MAASRDSSSAVEMRCEDENIWLTQKMMATLYDVDVRTVNEHLKKVFDDGELVEGEPTIRKFRIVQDEGGRQVSRDTWYYNLQAIIAAGFKVNNPRAVQFRKWAGQIVKDYTIQGWTMDVERLKKGHQMACSSQRGSWLLPMRKASTARAAWRPSRIAQTMSDWPRRMSPAANTRGTLVA